MQQFAQICTRIFTNFPGVIPQDLQNWGEGNPSPDSFSSTNAHRPTFSELPRPLCVTAGESTWTAVIPGAAAETDSWLSLSVAWIAGAVAAAVVILVVVIISIIIICRRIKSSRR